MGTHRILHVLGTAGLAGTAICQIVQNLAAAVDPEKYQIEACFLRAGEFVERFQSLGIKSTCVNWNGASSDPLGAARYAWLLASGEFSVIHQHTGGRLLTGIGRYFTRARIVRHVHGRASEDTGIVPSRCDLPARDVLIANSRIVADFCGDPGSIVVYPGVNVADFRVNRVPHVGVVVGTACRLELIKGLRYLVEAIAILSNEFPTLRLEIAGDGSLREALNKHASSLGVSGVVSFLGWREDMPLVMASWDIFVLPSLDEGFGVAALEAMAAELPVIASAVGGLPELIGDGESGLLVSPGAPAELASCIRDLMNDRQRRLSMGIAGRQRALQHFSVSEMVDRMIAVYGEISGAK
jgi:glycosyltransferase involved in cell wall biosynthesis